MGSLPDRDERRERDAARLAAQGKRVVALPSASTRRRVGVDNGGEPFGATGPTMGA